MKTHARIDIVDGLKAVAMQIIVLHHLVSYGPLADAARDALPDLFAWLYDHGRVAVQVFLVLGGYLAARALSRERGAIEPLATTLLNRYLRLVLPYAVALLLAVACAAYARYWIDDDTFIPAAPTLGQWFAHLFLLHDLLGYDALSTGVWYVAIDFQLFALLAVLARLSPRIGLLAIVALSSVAMFWFNRDAAYDELALYFFGAYGLGVAAYHARNGERFALRCQWVLWYASLWALLLDFRWRLLVALATAMLLHASHAGWLRFRISWPLDMAKWGRSSYALFLVHFPVYLLMSAACVRFEWHDGSAANALAGLGATWLLSLVAASALHHWIEIPTGRLRIRWTASRMGMERA